ncbi:MAG: SDR family oxidoreductase [Deltaproteobacteria bacterium]|nr:SDR family oxidoreductase [Deltaproteobacteria bacterium]
MKVAITGGAGFIGSHLCERLLDAGDEVLCVDNFYTGKKENVAHLLDNPRFECIRHDVIEPILLEVDRVFHLACPASPVHYQNNPVKTVKTNVMGTLNMLGLAKRVGARFLLASTSEVYGDPQVHPQSESYWGNVNPIGKRACYDEGKRVAETLTFDYHREHNVDTRVVRIFNTIGPRMSHDDGRVVSNFLVQALRGEDLTLFGEGKQTRSFSYVDDLVTGLLAMMEQKHHIGPINLGNDQECTILELANRVLSLVKSASKIVYMPLPEDDPVRRCPDLTLAKEVLGYAPTIALDESLTRTLAYFRATLRDKPKP